MKKNKNHLESLRQRRINRPSHSIVPMVVTKIHEKVTNEPIPAQDLSQIIRQYGDYSKIPNLITV